MFNSHTPCSARGDGQSFTSKGRLSHLHPPGDGRVPRQDLGLVGVRPDHGRVLVCVAARAAREHDLRVGEVGRGVSSHNEPHPAFVPQVLSTEKGRPKRQAVAEALSRAWAVGRIASPRLAFLWEKPIEQRDGHGGLTMNTQIYTVNYCARKSSRPRYFRVRRAHSLGNLPHGDRRPRPTRHQSRSHPPGCPAAWP